jgi:plastocyanin
VCGLIVAAATTAAGAAPAAGPNAAPADPEASVRIVRYASGKCFGAFEPADLRVKVGATVQFRNDDWEMHTVVSAEGEDPCNLEEVERATASSIWVNCRRAWR